jgi:hypothetical protein
VAPGRASWSPGPAGRGQRCWWRELDRAAAGGVGAGWTQSAVRSGMRRGGLGGWCVGPRQCGGGQVLCTEDGGTRRSPVEAWRRPGAAVSYCFTISSHLLWLISNCDFSYDANELNVILSA